MVLAAGSLETELIDVGARKIQHMREIIGAKNQALLSHRYFQMCRSSRMNREQVLDVLKQVYCFSRCFERLLTRRVTEYGNGRDERVLAIARGHLRNEIGHVDLFRQCLLENGVSQAELNRLAPKMFTKAMFGYLTATILHENEYVTNVAMMQVMESIGYHFFKETLAIMQLQGMQAEAFAQHAEDDERHLEEGYELIGQFDKETTETTLGVVTDLYRLMEFMLDEWLGVYPTSAGQARRRRSTRPPRSN
jgi:pyrroloquinoline quinone (PQQ) biosynthesis protein C